MEKISFINIKNGFLRELDGYKTKVKYKELFENLPDDIKTDLLNESEFCVSILTDEMLESVNTSYNLDAVRDISELPIDIEFFIGKYAFDNNILSKIGFNVYLKNNVSPSNLMQNITIFDFNINNKDILINYIYNILFYVYIFINDFRYNPLFNYFHHYKDIEHMKTIRLRHIRLFGDNDIECCVCADETISKTVCNHYLCKKCYVKLNTKICPICRRQLEGDESDNSSNFIYPSYSSLSEASNNS